MHLKQNIKFQFSIKFIFNEITGRTSIFLHKYPANIFLPTMHNNKIFNVNTLCCVFCLCHTSDFSIYNLRIIRVTFLCYFVILSTSGFIIASIFWFFFLYFSRKKSIKSAKIYYKVCFKYVNFIYFKFLIKKQQIKIKSKQPKRKEYLVETFVVFSPLKDLKLNFIFCCYFFI